MASPSPSQRRSGGGNRQPLFYRDLASPISAPRSASRFASPSAASPLSSIYRDNFAAASAAATPPPPPLFSLDDRPDFSPDPLPPLSPSSVSPRSPSPFNYNNNQPGSVAPTPRSGSNNMIENQMVQESASPGLQDWWSPGRGEGSPVDGMVQPGAGALITLPPPREVARPEMQRNGVAAVATGGLNEEEWVMVYGFSPADTNLVLREFEKCGVILKHVPGPRDANWMHILYQNGYDARKALRKDGVQINSVLVVGVKPVDPGQRQFLNEPLGSNLNGGFMASLPPRPFTVRSSDAVTPQGVFPRSNYLLTSSSSSNAAGNSGHRPTGAIASPAKSVVSKVMDLMFGI